MALTDNLYIDYEDNSAGFKKTRKVGANEVLFEGALVCIDVDGFLVKAADSANMKFDGIIPEASNVDNTGGIDGALSTLVWKDARPWITFAGAAITGLGKPVHATADDTIVLGVAPTTKRVDGIIIGWDTDRYQVDFSKHYVQV